MKSLADKLIAGCVVVFISLQTWTLVEVVSLKVAVAKLETRLDASHVATRAESHPGTSHLVQSHP